MEKVDLISEKDEPKSTEDVRSLLMACQFNAKFLKLKYFPKVLPK